MGRERVDRLYLPKRFIFHSLQLHWHSPFKATGIHRTQKYNAFACQRSISAVITSLAVLTIAPTASAAVLYNRETQHYYEFVPGFLTWNEAKTQAETRSVNGLQGYLATITSATENAFLVENFILPDITTPSTRSWGWIGVSDADREGDWKWVTGPEAGTSLQPSSASSSSSLSSLNLQQSSAPSYTNWASGEPNNYGDEDYAHLDYRVNRPAGQWNDANATARIGYFVEYGGLESVPEPTGALGLLLLGAWGTIRCGQDRSQQPLQGNNPRRQV